MKGWCPICAIFGWVARPGVEAGPDLRVLQRIALANEGRGPHAFGWAWVDGAGRLRMYKQTGTISRHLGLLRMVADARLLVGHLRWATHGHAGFNDNNHPHPADGGWVAHNGVVRNYRKLYRMLDVVPRTDCDSEVLGHLIEADPEGSVLGRCLNAARLVDPGPFAMLGLWARPGRLVAVRRGQPLHAGGSKHGSYLASLPPGLPGKVVALPDGHGFRFTTDAKETAIHARL